MRKFSVQDLTLAALLAAVYATLTLVLPIPAFTGIQIRMSEALTVLPFLFPAATPGLFVGCIVANLFSPYPLDIVCGSAATLLACLMTQRMPSRWLAPLPPVLCNAAIVGAEIAWFETGFGPGSARYVGKIAGVAAHQARFGTKSAAHAVLQLGAAIS